MRALPLFASYHFSSVSIEFARSTKLNHRYWWRIHGIEIAAELPMKMCAILGDDASARVIVIEKLHVIGPEFGVDSRPVVTRRCNRKALNVCLVFLWNKLTLRVSTRRRGGGPKVCP